MNIRTFVNDNYFIRYPSVDGWEWIMLLGYCSSPKLQVRPQSTLFSYEWTQGRSNP